MTRTNELENVIEGATPELTLKNTVKQDGENYFGEIKFNNVINTKGDSPDVSVQLANTDILGQILFKGQNNKLDDNGRVDPTSDIEYVKIVSRAENVNDGEEKGKISFKTACGSLVAKECLSITGGASAKASTTEVIGHLTIGGDLSIDGNFSVTGTTTTINSTVIDMVDPIITIGQNASDDKVLANLSSPHPQNRTICLCLDSRIMFCTSGSTKACIQPAH